MLALSLRGCSSCTAATRTRFRSFPYVRQTRPSAPACHRHASRSGKGWDGLPESEESRARVKSQMTMTKGKYVIDQLLARALSRLPRKRSSQEILRHTHTQPRTNLIFRYIGITRMAAGGRARAGWRLARSLPLPPPNERVVCRSAEKGGSRRPRPWLALQWCWRASPSVRPSACSRGALHQTANVLLSRAFWLAQHNAQSAACRRLPRAA